MSKPRRKRASPEDLYKSCALGGDCFPDVQNKIQGTTLADRLLQVFGSILYFGGLGIGSGKGTGGATGYRPFGGGGTVSRPSIRIQPESLPKPSVPIDPLGGAELIPLDVIDATAPSVVPLTEGVPETTIISSGTGPTITAEELDVTTQIDLNTFNNINEHPAVINVTDEGTTALDVQTLPPPSKKLILDSTITDQIELVPLHRIYTDQNVNMFVDTHFEGHIVGGDPNFTDIVLREEFEIEEVSPKTSTPTEKLSTAVGKARRVYNRFVKHVPTSSLEAVVNPSRQVIFEFENPAFDDEVSLLFNQELAEVTATPNPDFRDINYLSRPFYSETESGRVQYSRLGQRASMQTRSGLVIGEKVQFTYNISDIEPVETIELSTLGTTSADSIIQNAQAESVFIDAQDSTPLSYTEDLLLDEPNEDFANAHLVLTTTDDFGDTYDYPVIPPGLGYKLLIPNYNVTLNSFQLPEASIPTILPEIPFAPYAPSPITVFGDTFYLNPSLLKRKRKQYFY